MFGPSIGCLVLLEWHPWRWLSHGSCCRLLGVVGAEVGFVGRLARIFSCFFENLCQFTQSLHFCIPHLEEWSGGWSGLFEGGDEVACCQSCCVCWTDGGQRTVGGKEVDFPPYPFGACLSYIDAITSVMFWRMADVPSSAPMGVPCFPLVGGFVDDDLGSQWGHGRSIEIERAVEMCFC